MVQKLQFLTRKNAERIYYTPIWTVNTLIEFLRIPKFMLGFKVELAKKPVGKRSPTRVTVAIQFHNKKHTTFVVQRQRQRSYLPSPYRLFVGLRSFRAVDNHP